jgi:hypothetical protein
MSTDFEEAVIAFGQSLNANPVDERVRSRSKRELLRIVDAEFGEDNAFTNALKAIIARAEAGAERSGK